MGFWRRGPQAAMLGQWFCRSPEVFMQTLEQDVHGSYATAPSVVARNISASAEDAFRQILASPIFNRHGPRWASRVCKVDLGSHQSETFRAQPGWGHSSAVDPRWANATKVPALEMRLESGSFTAHNSHHRPSETQRVENKPEQRAHSAFGLRGRVFFATRGSYQKETIRYRRKSLTKSL